MMRRDTKCKMLPSPLNKSPLIKKNTFCKVIKKREIFPPFITIKKKENLAFLNGFQIQFAIECKLFEPES